MSTTWVVTTAAERIALNDAKQAEATFTVTNPGKRPDRSVFEAVPGQGADSSWFTVDDPQRRVLAAASVSYLLKIQVPDGTPPGTYEVQGRVYSADSAPEESSVLSGRVVFDVAAPPATAKRKFPWWIVIVAAALVVITVVVVTLVLTLGGDDAAPPPPVPSAAPTGPIAVPDVSKLNETQAVFELKRRGLTPGTIRHRQDPAHADQVLEQSVKPDTTVAEGTQVGLVVGVSLTAPKAKTPPGSQLKINEGKLEWDQTEPYVTRWVVTYGPQLCASFPQGVVCSNVNGVNSQYTLQERVDTKFYRPPLRLQQIIQIPPVIVTASAQFFWQVAAVDDFGTYGPVTGMTGATMVA